MNKLEVERYCTVLINNITFLFFTRALQFKSRKESFGCLAAACLTKFRNDKPCAFLLYWQNSPSSTQT